MLRLDNVLGMLTLGGFPYQACGSQGFSLYVFTATGSMEPVDGAKPCGAKAKSIQKSIKKKAISRFSDYLSVAFS